MHFISQIITLITCVTLASTAALPDQSINPHEILKRANTGQATFYGGNTQGGMCSFSTFTLPSGLYGTALSSSNWAGSLECGACVSVTGPSGGTPIVAMITDQCPGCGQNHLDLYPDAFKVLADPSKGVIDVSWNYVDCPITTPIQLHNKEGVSKYWFSMNVVNACKATKTLEASTDGGKTWQGTTREDYNYFQQSSGFGTTTLDIRITSVDGDVVIVNNVNAGTGGTTTTAGGNYPCSGGGSTSGGTASSSSSSSSSSSTTASSTATPTLTSTSEAPLVEHTTTSSSSSVPVTIRPTGAASNSSSVLKPIFVNSTTTALPSSTMSTTHTPSLTVVPVSTITITDVEEETITITPTSTLPPIPSVTSTRVVKTTVILSTITASIPGPSPTLLVQEPYDPGEFCYA